MKKGFTLVEMLFVISIIMILMLLVIPQVTKKTAVIKDRGCEALVDVVDGQIQLYEIAEGHLPSSVRDLIAGDYLEEKQAVCPNGHAIMISGGQAYSD